LTSKVRLPYIQGTLVSSDFKSRRLEVAVLVTSTIPGGNEQQAEQWISMGMMDRLREQPGLILHATGPGQGGWVITSIWESKTDFEKYFEENVKPNLPPGGPAPQDTHVELHDLVVGQAARRAAASA
jgi:hypothetical protein